MTLFKRIGGLMALVVIVVVGGNLAADNGAQATATSIFLSEISRFSSEEGAEISAYDPRTRQLFVAAGAKVEVIDLSNPFAPAHERYIDLEATSTAVKNGILAIAVPNDDGDLKGHVYLYRTFDLDTPYMYEVGYLPDMVTFTPDGRKVVVANEGEPDDGDPDGSVSIIDISGGIASALVSHALFTGYNGTEGALRDEGVRIFPGKTASEDFEPEYVAVSPDGRTAYVTLQENNAMAVVSINTATVTDLIPFGYKDHSVPGFGLDPSDEDGPSDGPEINIATWPVRGLFMPDGIGAIEIGGRTYLVTANEGDDRDDADSDRVKDLDLDPAAFPDPDIQDDDQLGRLNVSTIDGNTDGGSDYEELYSFGGRSFSIWRTNGAQVYDSGDFIEQTTAFLTPELFNAEEGAPEDFDTRSDNKGPEPEGVALGIVNCVPYAFIGLEEAGSGVMVFNISDPTSPDFVQYVRSDEDTAAEGLLFIPKADSPNGKDLLVVSNEVSETVTVYQINVDERPCDAPNPRLLRRPGGSGGGGRYR